MALNDSPAEARVLRGGNYANSEPGLRSSIRDPNLGIQQFNVGFRVASIVPEPSSALLMIGSGLMFLAWRRR